MKKLTLILSTILLMSSTSAFAKSKTSKVIRTDMGNATDCEFMVGVLNDVVSEEKDLRVDASCDGKILSSQFKVSYIITPTQKFEHYVGFDRPYSNHRRFGECKKIEKLMGEISGLNFSFNAWCVRKKDTYLGSYSVPTTRGYWNHIRGKISLK